MANGNTGGYTTRIVVGILTTLGAATCLGIWGLLSAEIASHADEQTLEDHIVISKEAHSELEEEDDKLKEAVIDIKDTITAIDTNLKILLDGYRGGN